MGFNLLFNNPYKRTERSSANHLIVSHLEDHRVMMRVTFQVTEVQTKQQLCKIIIYYNNGALLCAKLSR